MKDFYNVLGVSSDATDSEIKAAWRKLSKKFHPDKNDGDSFFEDYFKKVQEAYLVLSNPEKRHRYDHFRKQASNSNSNNPSSDQPHEKEDPRESEPKTQATDQPPKNPSKNIPLITDENWLPYFIALIIAVFVLGYLFSSENFTPSKEKIEDKSYHFESQSKDGYVLFDSRYSITFPERPNKPISDVGDVYEYEKPGIYKVLFSVYGLGSTEDSFEEMAKDAFDKFIEDKKGAVKLIEISHFTVKGRRYEAFLYVPDKEITSYTIAWMFFTFSDPNIYTFSFYANNIIDIPKDKYLESLTITN